MKQDAALEQQVCTVGDTQSVLDVVVGDEDAYVLVLQLPNDKLDVFDGNRVDAGEGLVEHDELRLDGQTARYLRTAALTTAELVTLVAAHLL